MVPPWVKRLLHDCFLLLNFLWCLLLGSAKFDRGPKSVDRKKPFLLINEPIFLSTLSLTISAKKVANSKM